MRRRSALATVTCLALAGLSLLPALATPAAQAATTAGHLDQSASGVASSMWQTNDAVDTLTTGNGILYAGGEFTSVRPPGSALGTNETPRTYLAAFSASTGALLTTFDVTLDGTVNDLELSPDGTELYLAGTFTTVDGVARKRIAAVDAATGALDTAFTADVNGVATALSAAGSLLYVGGDFTTVNGVAESRLAAVDVTTGAVDTAFSAALDVRPLAIDAVPAYGRVLVGGSFTTVDGTATGGMASVDSTTGALATWAANSVQPINTGCAGRVTAIVSQGDTAYVTGEGDPPGCYEGTYAAKITDGTMVWLSSCLGAAQGLAIMGNVLYKASHQHDCAFTYGDARGGFVGGTTRDDFEHWHLVGQAVGTGEFVHWNPNTDSAGDANIGPHAIATDGTQLFVGGDFLNVEKSAQQGLTRFAAGSGATPVQPAAPVVQATKAKTLTVTWPAVYDADNGTLTYSLYRNGSSTALYTTTAESWPWSRPMMRYDDTGLTAGSTYSYRITASDGTHVSTRSPTATGVPTSTSPSAYSTVVTALKPQVYWRMDSTADSSGNANSEVVTGSTASTTGAVSGSNALTLNGGFLASKNAVTLARFSEAIWFKTTSITGGSLMSMSTSQTGSGTTDRAITVDNNGNLVFELRSKAAGSSLGPALIKVRHQEPIYNNGRWHLAVGTYDGTTASFYIDGALMGTATGTAAGNLTPSYLRVGYSDLSAIQAVFGLNFYHQVWPMTSGFAGSVDEASVFSGALTAAQVSSLYAAGVNQGG